MTVSLVRFDGSVDSLRRAIELCDGFAELRSTDKILIKPNITYSGWVPMPPYGMVTTSKVVEGVLWLLAEHGCKDVSIGEGTIAGVLGSDTYKGYRYTGIDRVASRYGARLIDLNEGPFERRELGDIKVGVSRIVLDADFLINVPVLKTHSQVKVSLSFKNLKGCLDDRSRKSFHLKGLDHLICLLNQLLKCKLTIIDGIYMLEKGPDGLAGVPHRKNLIIASRDAFACDCIGATILGIEPSQVGYLREYAEANHRSMDTGAIQIAGENVESLKEKLEWELNPAEDLVGLAGITGLSIPSPGDTLCSGCYTNLAFAVGVFSRGNPNMDLGGTKIYCGRNQANKAAGERIVLYGNCAISSNRDDERSARLEGCPPKAMTTLLFLMKTLVSRQRMGRTLLLGSPKMLALRLGLYSGNHPRWKLYRPPEFDKSHFRRSRWEEWFGAFPKWRK